MFHYEAFRNRIQTLTTPREDLTFTYQPDGKLDTATTFDGQTLDFAYNGPVLTGAVSTGTVTGSVERSYDNSLRLDTLKVNGADPVSFTYDDDSLLLSAGALGMLLEPDTSRLDTVTVDQITTEWTYTPFGEPATVTTRHGGTVIYEESFVYDKRGWITDLDRTQNGSTVLETFGYDSRGRLETGRWTADDSASFSGTRKNLYIYSGSEPINWIDDSDFRKRAQVLATVKKAWDPLRHSAVRVYDDETSDRGIVYSHGGMATGIRPLDDYLAPYTEEIDPTVAYELNLSEEAIVKLENILASRIGPLTPGYNPFMNNCAEVTRDSVVQSSDLPSFIKSIASSTPVIFSNSAISDLISLGLAERGPQAITASNAKGVP